MPAGFGPQQLGETSRACAACSCGDNTWKGLWPENAQGFSVGRQREGFFLLQNNSCCSLHGP